MCVVCKSDECAHRIISNCHCDNLLGAWSTQHGTITTYHSKMRHIHKNMYIKHHILNAIKTHSFKLTKINLSHNRIIIYTKTQQQLKNPNRGKKHEILRENKKTHTFSWSLKKRWWRKMVDLWVKHGEYVRETNEEDNEQSEMFKRKLKSFKNCP